MSGSWLRSSSLRILGVHWSGCLTDSASSQLISSVSFLLCLLSSLSLSLSLFISLFSSLSLLCLFSSLSFLLCLCHFSSLFLFSIAITMIARPVGSLCTHGPDSPSLPECVGRGPFIVGRSCSHHARKHVLAFLCKPLATWNEVGLYLCWKEYCAWCGGVLWCVVVVVVSVVGWVVLLHVCC